MITTITGTPGSGKTLWMTYKALDLVMSGQDIYANWSIDFSKYFQSKGFTKDKLDTFGRVFYWSEIGELYPIEGGTLFIDEIAKYFDARNWAKMSEAIRQKFSGHRHDATIVNGKVVPLDIFIGVQHLSHMDTRIASLGQEFLYIKNIKKILFQVQYYDLKELKNDVVKRRPLRRKFFWFDKAKADCYNNREKFYDYPLWEFYRQYPEKFANRNSGLLKKGEVVGRQGGRASAPTERLADK